MLNPTGTSLQPFIEPTDWSACMLFQCSSMSWSSWLLHLPADAAHLSFVPQACSAYAQLQSMIAAVPSCDVPSMFSYSAYIQLYSA